jgi:hypothetical protein
MGVIYKLCTGEDSLSEHVCEACGGTEKGGLSGAVYFHRDIKSALTESNLSSLSWWKTQIEAEKAVIVPTTRGTCDGGAKNTITGFGRKKEKVTGKTYTAVVNDAVHAGNLDFYQSLENGYDNYIFGFCTENELRIAGNTIRSVEVKDAVEEDIDSLVLWQATITWIQDAPETLLPVHVMTEDVKALFNGCIEDIEIELD